MSCCDNTPTCEPTCPEICWNLSDRIQVEGILQKEVSWEPCDQIITLRVDCCEYEDKLVAVEPDCEPWYLVDQIISDPGSPIIVYAQDCKVRIWFNPDLIPDLDSKVAVDSSCEAWYLEDQVLGWDGILITKIDCQLEWSIDPTDDIWLRPWARITLDTTYDNSTIPDGNEWGTDIIWLTITDTNDPTMLIVPNRISITKAWVYHVGFKWVVEFNDAVHAFRVLMLSNNTANVWALDDKHSAGRTSGSFTGGDKLGLWPNTMSLPVGQTNIIRCQLGEVIRPAIRWSITVDVPKVNIQGQIVIVGNSGSSITPPFAASTTNGFSFWASYIETF